MVLKTVGELKKALEQYPDDMPIKGYDGSDKDCLVSVWTVDYAEVPKKERPPETLMIDVD